MTQKEANKLPHGLYKLYWRWGGWSFAAVGSLNNGDRWYACCDFINRTTNTVCCSGEGHWELITKAHLLLQDYFPKEEEKQEAYTTEIFGQKVEVRKEGNTTVIDGGKYAQYTDTPVLAHPDEIYYSGCGRTWDTDLNGKRYWKRYSRSHLLPQCADNYPHLRHGDIIEEKERIRKIVIDVLKETF